MDHTTTLGAYLRAERQRRDLLLKTISESTKVSLPLLQGLESDDISRWPGGIFRRAFVRSYAEAVGLDPDDVFRRFERQYKPAMPDATGVDAAHTPAEIVGPGAGHWRFPFLDGRRSVEPGPVSRNCCGPDGRRGAGLRQCRGRFTTSLARPADCGLLRSGCTADGDEPHGGPPRDDALPAASRIRPRLYRDLARRGRRRDPGLARPERFPDVSSRPSAFRSLPGVAVRLLCPPDAS